MTRVRILYRAARAQAELADLRDLLVWALDRSARDLINSFQGARP